jgi:hypothetical protein
MGSCVQIQPPQPYEIKISYGLILRGPHRMHHPAGLHAIRAVISYAARSTVSAAKVLFTFARVCSL